MELQKTTEEMNCHGCLAKAEYVSEEGGLQVFLCAHCAEEHNRI